MKHFLFILLLATFSGLPAWAAATEKPVGVHAYLQFRGTSDLKSEGEFFLRRLKVWVRSEPGFSRHWSFKVQTTFTSLHKEKFFLQDVKLNYRWRCFSLDMGQFVPAFSLQRSQHDYRIAPIERARVVNVLIPDGTLGVRDLGFQLNYHTRGSRFRAQLGVFNGYGIKDYRPHNRGIMVAHRSKWKFSLPSAGKVLVGYSLMYRWAEDLPLYFVLPDSVRFTGKDVRTNLFGEWKWHWVDVQAEVIRAHLKGNVAYGYYLLCVLSYRRSQWVFSGETYHDLIESTADIPMYRLGYNYLVDDYRIRLSLDNRFEIKHHRVSNYRITIQLQFFLLPEG
jgi:hypothetical protein